MRPLRLWVSAEPRMAEPSFSDYVKAAHEREKAERYARRRRRVETALGWFVELAAWVIVLTVAVAAGWAAVTILRAVFA